MFLVCFANKPAVHCINTNFAFFWRADITQILGVSLSGSSFRIWECVYKISISSSISTNLLIYVWHDTKILKILPEKWGCQLSCFQKVGMPWHPRQRGPWLRNVCIGRPMHTLTLVLFFLCDRNKFLFR